MARKRDPSTEKDDQEGEEQKVVSTMVQLTLANKKYLFMRKAEGKGSPGDPSVTVSGYGVANAMVKLSRKKRLLATFTSASNSGSLRDLRTRARSSFVRALSRPTLSLARWHARSHRWYSDFHRCGTVPELRRASPDHERIVNVATEVARGDYTALPLYNPL